MNTTHHLEALVKKYIPYAEMLSEIGNNAVYIVDKYRHYYFISDKFSLSLVMMISLNKVVIGFRITPLRIVFTQTTWHLRIRLTLKSPPFFPHFPKTSKPNINVSMSIGAWLLMVFIGE